MAPPTRILRDSEKRDIRRVETPDFGDDVGEVYGDEPLGGSIRQILSGLTVSGTTLVPKPATVPASTPVPVESATIEGVPLADGTFGSDPFGGGLERPRPAASGQPVPPMPKRTSNPGPTATATKAPVIEAPEESPDYPALPTAEELEAIQMQAREEGFELGRREGEKAGRAEGTAAARAEYATQITQLHNLLTDLHARVTEQDQDVELELVDLAVSIATRVLHRELHTHPDHILAAVRAGLAQLPSQQLNARIVLNPDDLEAIRTQLVPDEPERRWTLIADAGLSRGSYRLEAGRAELSVDIQQRLEEAIDAILGGSDDLPARALESD